MKPEHKNITISGTVTAVFAHRFVINCEEGKHLANIGPDAIDIVDLQKGDRVTIEGECKPSEIKVTKITIGCNNPIDVERIKKHQHGDEPEFHDPRIAINAVERDGFVVMGEPRRKPKHFEILGQSMTGTLTEFHVEFDGEIHKKKSADRDDPKWREAFRRERHEPLVDNISDPLILEARAGELCDDRGGGS
jgi:hypothetical protein